jgi:lantibiotic modifying enzyme
MISNSSTNVNVDTFRASLEVMAARASTLHERLAEYDSSSDAQPDEKLVHRRMTSWMERMAKGDRAPFEQLLAAKCWNMEAVRRALGTLGPAGRPPWIEIFLKAVLKAEADPFASTKDGSRFDVILLPFIRVAEDRIREQEGHAHALAQSAIHRSAHKTLLYWLASMCSPAFQFDCSLFGIRHRLVNGALETSERYIQEMTQGRLVSFFAEYPVLARGVATVTAHWADAVAEFLHRLSGDRQILEEAFFGGKPLGNVSHLDTGLSDPQNGARSVYAVTFETGLKLIYKPKSLNGAEAFRQLLMWTEARGASLPLQAVQTLPRGPYGWTNFINHSYPTTGPGLERFYRRCGMLLALFRLLNTTDVHNDNLMASGENPILIDSETLITPSWRSEAPGEHSSWAEVRAARIIEDSILKTAMLPTSPSESGQVSADTSALGHGPLFQEECSHRREVLVDEIVDGFREIYGILLKHRQELSGAGSPLRAFAEAPMRFVFRETGTYFSLLKNSLDPRFLRHGVDRSIELEVLKRVLGPSSSAPRKPFLIEAEVRALEQFDIPYFTFVPESAALNLAAGGTVDDFFPAPTYRRLLQTVRNLSWEDREMQVDTIRGALYAKALNENVRMTSEVAAPRTPSPILGTAALIDAAVEIAHDLDRCAIQGGDGSRAWLALSYRPAVKSHGFGLLGPQFYDGLAGIALFLAAVEKVSGVRKFRPTLEGATRRFPYLPPTPESLISIYPLVRISQFLGESSFLELAAGLASKVDPRAFATATHLDLRHGLAGALIGLLALYGATSSQAVIDLAIGCGDTLRTKGNASVPGLDLALTRLHRICGEPRFQREPRGILSHWIPGITGEGYLRLEELGGPNDLEARSQAHSIVSTAIGASAGTHDSLPGGTFAQIDFLIEADRLLSRPDALRAGLAKAAEATWHAGWTGGFILFENLPPEARGLGLFHGATGIGYTLLRLASPLSLPSILALR